MGERGEEEERGKGESFVKFHRIILTFEILYRFLLIGSHEDRRLCRVIVPRALESRSRMPIYTLTVRHGDVHRTRTYMHKRFRLNCMRFNIYCLPCALANV